ncbi:DsbA family protein [Sphingomonas sp. BN140010]|uniref:DsbA family protein n=1 Tax=Sphingomonas arvum TaxID=2992113 RepID=A0ABT3JGR4_9SPHN|nr:DsbA family protein [Sphingomonas sp. BN140010]MCW3798270.1 DsbA family protein [Sphingomonas sp. BN140010]
MSETTRGRSPWGAALMGALGGTLLTLIFLVLAARAGWLDRYVRETMVRDPDILIAASEALKQKQFAPTLAANRAALETPFASSWEGARDGDVTLVEFYDYACGYCRASLPVLDRLIKEDPKLKVVYREFPILGEGSVAASRMALGASKAGKFLAFHDALYAAGHPDEAGLTSAAKAAGVPAAVPQSPDIETELKRNYQLAQELGATGTPLFVIGDQVFNGAVGYDALKKAIADARARRS